METVIRKLTQVIERPPRLPASMGMRAMNAKAVMRSIELLGKEVIPVPHEIPLPEHGD